MKIGAGVSELWGGRKLPSPIDKAHGLYNSLYMYYRTSRDSLRVHLRRSHGIRIVISAYFYPILVHIKYTCVIRFLIIIYALRLFPFLLFRLPKKPGVILENYTNPVSHLFVTVIPSPNALSMCGILSPSVLWCLNLFGDFRHQVNKLHFCDYFENGI